METFSIISFILSIVAILMIIGYIIGKDAFSRDFDVRVEKPKRICVMKTESKSDYYLRADLKIKLLIEQNEGLIKNQLVAQNELVKEIERNQITFYDNCKKDKEIKDLKEMLDETINLYMKSSVKTGKLSERVILLENQLKDCLRLIGKSTKGGGNYEIEKEYEAHVLDESYKTLEVYQLNKSAKEFLETMCKVERVLEVDIYSINGRKIKIVEC